MKNTMLKMRQLRYVAVTIGIFIGADVFAGQVKSQNSTNDTIGWIALCISILAISICIASWLCSNQSNFHTSLENKYETLDKKYQNLDLTVKSISTGNNSIEQGINDIKIQEEIIRTLKENICDKDIVWCIGQKLIDQGLIPFQAEENKQEVEEFVLVSKAEVNLETPPFQDDFDVNNPAFFAGTVDLSTGNFYRTTSNVDTEKTVFEFVEKGGNRAVFRVHKIAKNRILEDQSFLEGSCEVQDIGHSPKLVETTENGIVEKQVDGKWKVLIKAKVRLS